MCYFQLLKRLINYDTRWQDPFHLNLVVVQKNMSADLGQRSHFLVRERLMQIIGFKKTKLDLHIRGKYLLEIWGIFRGSKHNNSIVLTCAFQSRKRLYNYQCPFICPSVTKPPYSRKSIIQQHHSHQHHTQHHTPSHTPSVSHQSVIQLSTTICIFSLSDF